MTPIVHGLEDIFSDQINFTYLDIDDPGTTEFKRALGYNYQPEYYLLGPDGEVIMVWFGFVPPESFISAFQDALVQ